MAWTQYWPLYQRLEIEFEELTFSIELVDAHKAVYSSKLAELLMRACSECENAARTLLTGRRIPWKNDSFRDLGVALCSTLNLNWRELDIVWPYQQLTNRKVSPFATWSNGTPEWFKAYNKIKHDRDASKAVANYWNVIEALGGLFILNVWLRFSLPLHTVQVELLSERPPRLSEFFAHDELFLPPDGTALPSVQLNEEAKHRPFYVV